MPFFLILVVLLFSAPAFALPVLFSQNYKTGTALPSFETINVTEPLLQIKVGDGAVQFQKGSVFRVISDKPAVIEVISGDVQVFADADTAITLKYNDNDIQIDPNSSLQMVAGDKASGQVYHGKITVSGSSRKRGFSQGQKFSLSETVAQAELESLGAIAPAAGGDEQGGDQNESQPLANDNNNQIQNQIAGDLAFLSAQQDVLNRLGNNDDGNSDGDTIGDGDDNDNGDDGAAQLYPPTAIPLQGREFAGSNHRVLDKASSRTSPITRKDVIIGDDGMPTKIIESSTVWFWNDYLERVTARIAEAQGGTNWQVGRFTDGTVNVEDFLSFEPAKERTLSRNQGLHYALGEVPTNIPTEGVGVYNLVAATRPTYVDGSTAPGELSGDITVRFGSIPTVGVNLIATMPDGTWRLFKDAASDPADFVTTIGPGYGGFMVAANVSGDACENGRFCIGNVLGSLVGEGATGAALTFEASSGLKDENGIYTPDQLLTGAGYFNRIP